MRLKKNPTYTNLIAKMVSSETDYVMFSIVSDQKNDAILIDHIFYSYDNGIKLISKLFDEKNTERLIHLFNFKYNDFKYAFNGNSHKVIWYNKNKEIESVADQAVGLRYAGLIDALFSNRSEIMRAASIGAKLFSIHFTVKETNNIINVKTTKLIAEDI